MIAPVQPAVITVQLNAVPVIKGKVGANHLCGSITKGMAHELAQGRFDFGTKTRNTKATFARTRLNVNIGGVGNKRFYHLHIHLVLVTCTISEQKGIDKEDICIIHNYVSTETQKHAD